MMTREVWKSADPKAAQKLLFANWKKRKQEQEGVSSIPEFVSNYHL